MDLDPNNPRRLSPPGNLDREESQLWRWLLGFMLLLAFALTGLLWERLERIPYSLRAIPIGVLVLSVLFAVYAAGRRREVGELEADNVHTPSIYVKRIFQGELFEKRIERRTVQKAITGKQ